MNEINTILEKLSFRMFKNFTPEEVQQVVEFSTLKRFRRGEIIIHEGDMVSSVYCILNGSVTITRKDEETKKIIHLATREAMQVIGEIGIITKKPEIATVTATIDVDALVIDFFALEKVIKDHPIHTKLLNNLAEIMAEKLVYSAPTTFTSEETIFDENNTELPDTILLLFGWKWKDIINEVPFLSAHGYDAIKISPPEEFAVLPGRPWYEAYQPVTYNLSSFYGTEEEFRAMVDICHTFNIKIFADLVMNHMAEYPLASENKKVGTNGHEFSKYHYGPLNSDNDYYEYNDFYHFASTDNQLIAPEDYASFDKSWRVEHFDLSYLPKLNFDNPHVIEVLRKYANYLLYLGVHGFRIDAAKHISTDALAKILRGLKTREGLNPFAYLEFYAGFPPGVDPYSYMEKYFNLGYVTSFSYGEFIADALLGRNNSLGNLVQYSLGSSWTHFPENRAVVVLDNHDTERAMPNMLSYKNNHNNCYVLGYIFMLSWPFGVPKIMSSFHFSKFEDPIPQTPVWRDGRNTCFDPGSPWVGQHRWRAICNMVLFRKRTKEAKGISHVWTNINQVAFARTYQKPKKYVATVGFVVINNSAQKLQRKFETNLPAGNYSNLIACDFIEGKMHGPVIKVEDYGFTEITVEPYDAVVICIDFME